MRIIFRKHREGVPCNKEYERPDGTIFTCERTVRHWIHLQGDQTVIPLPRGGWIEGWTEPKEATK